MIAAAGAARWLVALGLLGCMGQADPYPSGWARLGKAKDCAWLLGTYANQGERSGTMGMSLFRLLTSVYDGEKRRPEPYPHVRAITLSMPEPGLLEAAGDGARQQFRADRGEFVCRDGRIEFAGSVSDSGNVGASTATTTVQVVRDVEGLLVVRWEQSGVAMLGFVVPAGVRSVAWYRFRPVEP